MCVIVAIHEFVARFVLFENGRFSEQLLVNNNKEKMISLCKMNEIGNKITKRKCNVISDR